MRRKIRLAQLTLGLSSGGIEARVARILAGLDREEFEPIWIAFADAPSPTLTAAGAIEVELLGHRETGWLDSAGAQRLTSALARTKPDVIHVHNWSTGLYGTLAARWAGVPAVIFGYGGRDVAEKPRARQRATMHALATQVDRFTTVASFLADEITESWGVSRSSIEVIPTGIDLDRLAHGLPRGEARARLSIPEDAVVVGTTSMFRPVKRLEDLIDAAADVARSDPRVHLLIVGENPMPPFGIPPEIVARPSAQALGARLHLPGRIEDGAKLLNAFDVWVNCSIFEGSSNAILEALAASLPVVATAVGGTPELIEDGLTGLLVAPASPDPLARAIRTLILDAELRRRLATQGATWVRQQHGLAQMIERYATLYRGAATVAPRSRSEQGLRGVRGLLRGGVALLR